MNKYLCSLAAGLCLAGHTMAAAPAAGGPFVMLIGSGIDTATTARVAATLADRTAIRVETRSIEPAPAKPSEALAAVQKTKADGALCRIAVWKGPDAGPVGFDSAEEKAYVLNVGRLAAGGANAETVATRAERYVMKALAHALKIQKCPNPQCVLHPAETPQQIDLIALDYCPPCKSALRAAAGVPDSPRRPRPAAKPEAKPAAP